MVPNTNAFQGGFRLWEDENSRAKNFNATSAPASVDRTNGSAVKKEAKRKGASAPWQQA